MKRGKAEALSRDSRSGRKRRWGVERKVSLAKKRRDGGGGRKCAGRIVYFRANTAKHHARSWETVASTQIKEQRPERTYWPLGRSSGNRGGRLGRRRGRPGSCFLKDSGRGRKFAFTNCRPDHLPRSGGSTATYPQTQRFPPLRHFRGIRFLIAFTPPALWPPLPPRLPRPPALEILKPVPQLLRIADRRNLRR